MNTNDSNSIQPVDFNRSLNEQLGMSTADVVFVNKKAQQLESRQHVGNVLVDQPHAKLRGPNLQADQFHNYTQWLADIQAAPIPEQPSEIIDRKTSETDREPDSTPLADFSEPARLPTQTATFVPAIAEKTQESIVKKLVARLKNKRITNGHSPVRLTPNMWEVDSFLWPRQTDELLALSAKSMDVLAEASLKLLSPPNTRLAFAGTSKRSGTTTIMVSVGRLLAAKRKRVLMIDANFGNPELSSRLNLSQRISWLDAVRRKQDANQSIVRGLRSDLYVMPLASLGARTNWPSHILDWLGDIVNEVKNRFDVVLIDVGAAPQLMQELSQSNLLTDAAVLVNNVARTSPQELGQFRSSLSKFGLDRIVIADNHVADP